MKSSKILIVDNYDSFTYNLVHLIHECGYDVDVKRNDKFELEDLKDYTKILLSPGPGIPSEAGKLIEVIKEYAGKTSIMGVCLGQQAMAEAFGGKLCNLPEPLHGVATDISVETNDPLFKGCPESLKAGRYHSWVVNKKNVPDCFKVIAIDKQNEVMAIRHKEYDLVGVQFHPESVLTEYGKLMIKNWIEGN